MEVSKSCLGPFFVTLHMSVWDTLKAVLEADSAKQLHFQKSASSGPEEEPSTAGTQPRTLKKQVV